MKMSRCRYRTSLAGFISALLLAVSADAATITVNSTADAGGTCPGATCTLRQAIATAASGDTINFAAGITTITLTTAELLINKNLIISGPGANLLSVQRSAAGGTPEFRIFNISGNFTVTISGLTIANGNNPGGGGILNNTGALTITNSTISGNFGFSAGQGGGIYNLVGMLTITNSTISGNSFCAVGGGIFNDGGTLTITNSTISGNLAVQSQGRGGGIYINSGTVTVTNSTISGNSAINGGGIYRAGGTVNARNTIIAQNTVTVGGSFPDFSGLLTSQGYNLIGNTSGTTITGTTTGNQLNVNPVLGPLQTNGGPTFTHALGSGSPAIEGGQSFGSNTDQRGLARPVVIPNTTPIGDGSDIGAYEVQADLLPGCNNINRIVNNNNDGGTGALRFVIGDVCAGSTITFAPNVTGAINLTSGELLINKPLTINGPGANLLSVQRGAGAPNFRIFNIAPASVIATISGLTIANGNAPGTKGGGIYNTATLTLTNSSVIGNSADFSNGGGIFNDGVSLTLTNSTISGNTASGSSTGGGIGNTGGTVTITNSTISGNTVSGSFSTGGGILNNSGTITITNSTISGNSAPGSFSGGGINNGGTVRARNTIIALNTSPTGPDVNGALTSENFNLVGNNSGATITPAQFSDQIGTPGSPINPMLGSLQDNGGPTFTRSLLAGSTAIDKGHSSSSATDQRGFLRPVDNPAIPNATDGDGGDIGAFEVSVNIAGTISYCSNPVPGPVPNVMMTVTGTSGAVTLTDPLGNYSLFLPSGGSFTVTPTKTARVPGSANINTQDVIATQRHFLGLGTPLAGCKLVAADVTGDTLVNTSDVIAIQRFFLGLSTGIANVGKYKFTPANRSYSGIVTDQTAQNYDTLVFGDTASSFVELVEGPEPTAVDDGTSVDQVPAMVATLSLPNVAVDAFVTNFIVQVTTTTMNASDRLVGFQGDFTFDERVVTFQSEPVQKAGSTGGNWNVSGNVLPGPGPIRTLRISAYSLDFAPLSGSGTLFELRMTKVGQATQGTPLLWAAPPDHFVFIDADLKTQKPGNAAPGGVSSSAKRK